MGNDEIGCKYINFNLCFRWLTIHQFLKLINCGERFQLHKSHQPSLTSNTSTLGKSNRFAIRDAEYQNSQKLQIFYNFSTSHSSIIVGKTGFRTTSTSNLALQYRNFLDSSTCPMLWKHEKYSIDFSQ